VEWRFQRVVWELLHVKRLMHVIKFDGNRGHNTSVKGRDQESVPQRSVAHRHGDQGDDASSADGQFAIFQGSSFRGTLAHNTKRGEEGKK